MCVLEGNRGYNACTTALQTINPVYILDVLAVNIIKSSALCANLHSTSFCDEDSNHIFSVIPRSNRTALYSISLPESRVTISVAGRELLSGKSWIQDKSLKSCISRCQLQMSAVVQQVLCCVDTAHICLFYLLLFLLEEIIKKTGLRSQMETVYLFNFSGKKEEINIRCVNQLKQNSPSKHTKKE